jgi:hypothetical protein
MSEDNRTPGWDAIDRACDALYGGQEPLHYGTIVRHSLVGRDPLDGISVYKNAGPPCHWHFVSYGLSELYDKESDDPEVSGFGFELTFRLACASQDETPPVWSLDFQQNLARYVFETGNAFGPNHHMDLNSPIALEEETDIRAVAFATDSQLGAIDTPHGRLTFLQVVGLTHDELGAIKDWNTGGLLEVLAEGNPLLVTDLSRHSLLSDPVKAETIRERTEREGSSLNGVRTDVVQWLARQEGGEQRAELTLGAAHVITLKRLLRGRILYGRDCWLAGPDQSVRFEPAPSAAWQVKGDQLTVKVPAALVRAIDRTLPPERGTYSWPELAGFTLHILPTEIKDQDGNVTEVVG